MQREIEREEPLAGRPPRRSAWAAQNLLESVEALIDEQLLSAEWAWKQAVEEQSALLASLPDATLAERAGDVRDMGARVLSHLLRPSEHATPGSLASPAERPALIVTRDLTPSQTARLDPASILGICTVEGGPTTHAAIIARALEIPAVAGLDMRVLAELREDQLLAIDGGRGLLYLQPDEEQRIYLSAALAEQQRKKKSRDTAHCSRPKPPQRLRRFYPRTRE